MQPIFDLVIISNIIKDLKKILAIVFLREEYGDIAEAWLREFHTHFDTRNYTSNQNVIYVVLLLRGYALEWWEGLLAKRKVLTKDVPWEDFEKVFKKMYIYEMIELEKWGEFDRLCQRGRIIDEYHCTFIRLIKYVSKISNSSKMKVHKFMGSFDHDICTTINLLAPKTLQKA